MLDAIFLAATSIMVLLGGMLFQTLRAERSIVAALNQSIKFGTPLAGSLRMLAAEMRAERLARFEERAARLPVLLTVPLMAFILPSLLLVIGAPLALRIIDALGRGG